MIERSVCCHQKDTAALKNTASKNKLFERKRDVFFKAWANYNRIFR